MAEVGTAVVFLILPPGARANGMGQAFVAVADDATGSYYNPAGPALRPRVESCCLPWPIDAHLSHSPWMPVFQLDDLYLRYSSFTQSLPRAGTITVSSSYLHVGNVMETDEDNNELGTFMVYDMAISLNYSVRLAPSISVGVTLKDIYSQLHPSAVACSWACDFGVLYRPPVPVGDRPILSVRGPSFGLSLANRGPDISYGACPGDGLPELLRVGLAEEVWYSKYARLLLSTEINKIMVNFNEGTFAEELRESKRCIGSELTLWVPFGRLFCRHGDRAVL